MSSSNTKIRRHLFVLVKISLDGAGDTLSLTDFADKNCLTFLLNFYADKTRKLNLLLAFDLSNQEKFTVRPSPPLDDFDFRSELPLQVPTLIKLSGSLKKLYDFLASSNLKSVPPGNDSHLSTLFDHFLFYGVFDETNNEQIFLPKGKRAKQLYSGSPDPKFRFFFPPQLLPSNESEYGEVKRISMDSETIIKELRKRPQFKEAKTTQFSPLKILFSTTDQEIHDFINKLFISPVFEEEKKFFYEECSNYHDSSIIFSHDFMV